MRNPLTVHRRFYRYKSRLFNDGVFNHEFTEYRLTKLPTKRLGRFDSLHAEGCYSITWLSGVWKMEVPIDFGKAPGYARDDPRYHIRGKSTGLPLEKFIEVDWSAYGVRIISAQEFPTPAEAIGKEEDDE